MDGTFYDGAYGVAGDCGDEELERQRNDDAI
jgi:hypothetical protein